MYNFVDKWKLDFMVHVFSMIPANDKTLLLSILHEMINLDWNRA